MRKFFVILFISGLSLFANPEQNNLQLVEKKIIYLTQVKYNITISISAEIDSSKFLSVQKDGKEWYKDSLKNLKKTKRSISFDIEFPSSGTHLISIGDQATTLPIKVIPGWFSLLPPLAAILLALITRQVLIALFAGVWLGTTFIYGFNPFTGFLFSLTEYVGKAPVDAERIAILIFSLALGGMIGVISKSGGTQGIVEKLSKYASNRRKGQIATWLMGVLIFFDDYANTLIVGNTMRPLTDKLKISREKLSYLVDSTAAPVANIAIISTWIGYELSLINESFQNIGLNQNAYITFFKTIPVNFYPIFALVFGFSIAYFGRDFFSMYKAEKRTEGGKGVLREGAVPLADLSSGDLAVKKNAPLRWYNAVIPVSMVIITTLVGLWFTGLHGTNLSAEELQNMNFVQYISTIIGNSDSFSVLMWASFIGGISAIILALIQRILTLNEAIIAWVGGVKAMVMAALILILAWAIGNICADIQTADYVVSLTRDLLSPHWIPTLSFLIAGVIAFATGTSWGTMAILTPIVIPLGYQLPALDPGISESAGAAIFLSSIASILAGATFGDHCSPISDTTIMSSMASGADHIDHVRTQLPYAFIVGGISILFGYLPVGYGMPGWIMLIIGAALIFLLVRFVGKKIE